MVACVTLEQQWALEPLLATAVLIKNVIMCSPAGFSTCSPDSVSHMLTQAVAEHLPKMHRAVHSIPNTTQKRGRALGQ